MYNRKYDKQARCGIVLLGMAVLSAPLIAAERDALFVNEPHLTAANLVQAVLHRNADIPAMQATWQAAKSRIPMATSFDDPMLSYSVAPQTIDNSEVDFAQKITYSQRLPWPGKRDLRGGVARFEAGAAFEGIEQARLNLTEMAQTSHADWYYVHAALRINAINTSLLETFQNIAEIKYSAGYASKQDTLRAELELALLEHHDIVLERRRRDVLAHLNTLLQRAPDLPLPLPSQLSDPAPLPPIEGLRTLALSTHPELRRLAAHQQASRQRERLAKRDFYPDIDLNIGYNSLRNLDENRFTIGASINIPLQGRRDAASDEARAMTISLNAQHQGMASQVVGKVQRAYDQVHESAHVITLYRQRWLPLAEENLQAAQSDYEAGSGSFLDLISVEKKLMQTHLQLEQTLADYHRNLAALARTVGGEQHLYNTHVEVTP